MFDRNEFNRCVFYPESGADLGLLVQYAEDFDTFVCPNVSIGTPEDYLNKIDEEVDRINNNTPGIIERLGEPRSFTRNDMDFGAYDLPGNVFTAEQRRQYINANRDYRNPANWWGRKITFRLNVNNQQKDLYWYIFTAEGLASYQALSHKGQYPCNLFISYQIDENLQPILERLITGHANRPQSVKAEDVLLE